MIGQPKTVSWVIVSRIGLRGVFQYCVTRYLIVWPFLGALPFSTVLQSECKRSRSRKARQSFHNLLKIVFHTWLVYYQVPLMIGEIPISDACHYMDAHDTETRVSGGISRYSEGCPGFQLKRVCILQTYFIFSSRSSLYSLFNWSKITLHLESLWSEPLPS